MATIAAKMSGRVPMSQAQPTLPQRRIFQAWWPLAASWMLMGLELPLLSAVVARLADPKIHLAAYGGVVFPLALLIESPVIMLLAASTALSKDWKSYQFLNRFMLWSGGLLTVLHVLLAFTSLYDLLIVSAFNPPPEVVEPARIGLMIMTPWTWAIAFRRFNQGVLIRYGRSRSVTVGTGLRLMALTTVLGTGYALARMPGADEVWGIVVGTSAIAVAVTVEAIYVGIRVHPVLRDKLKPASTIDPPLTAWPFAKFYVPLVMTSLLTLVSLPLGTAAIARMPNALDSLAVWPVVSGVLFLIVSTGIAYNEVVVALLDARGSVRPLRRFAWGLALTTTVFLVLLTATPLAQFWFGTLSGLAPPLAQLAAASMWFALLRPAMSAMQNWYQGALIHFQQTRAITEAVAAFLLISAVLLVVGVFWQPLNGLFMAQLAFSAGALVQTGWLWWRSRPPLHARATSAERLLKPPPSTEST